MPTHVTPAAHLPRRALLPDACLAPHPVGTWLLAIGFDFWIRTAYHREIVVPDGFHLAPGTLIAFNHRRDADGPLLGTVLANRKGLCFDWQLPFYATREDLFRSGILARLTGHWPRPLSRLVGRIPMAWLFSLGRAEPLRRVREFTLGETLNALIDAGLGDADCATVLNARGQRETGLRANTCSVRAAATRAALPLESWWGLRRLTLPAVERIAPAFRATIAAQLAHFAQQLDAGRSVYFSPEGTLSTSGRFGRIRTGFFELVHTTRTPPWIQPMALGYDALAPGRLRVVVRAGDRFRADITLDRRAFNALLKQRVLGLAAITPSHLLARFLLHGPASFTHAELAAWFANGPPVLRAQRASLDPLYATTDPRMLAGQRLRWLERRRIALREGNRWRNMLARNVPPGWQTPAHIARYLDNALTDAVPDVAELLPC